MRTASTLALSALLLLAACKGDDGDTSTTGAEAHCSAGWGDGPEVDPDYPPCDCDPSTCANGGTCRFSGLSPEWESSLCSPACSNGPSCPNASDACEDNDCPALGTIKPLCASNRCVVPCDDKSPCPAGYTCGGDNTCQVRLE